MPDDAIAPGGKTVPGDQVHVRGYTRWRNGQQETVSAYDRQGRPATASDPTASDPAASLTAARSLEQPFQEICPLNRGVTR